MSKPVPLPIRQRLSALTSLKAGPKAVLIEVCELYEHGGRGCFASNDALAKKLGISLATVTRTVATLVGYGLLQSTIVKAEANRRYLVPAVTIRACYTGEKEADQLAAVAELTIVKKRLETELTIVKNETDYSQNGELTIVKNETDYSQNASRVLGDDQYDQLDDQDDHSLPREERALLEKKIADLETENARLHAKILELAPPVAAPPHRPPAVAPPPQATPPPAAESGATFEEFWSAYAKKVDNHKCAQRWKVLTVAERVAAVAAAGRYVAATPEKRFRKNPLTWLNGKCWQDEEVPDLTTRPLNASSVLPAPARAATSLAKTATQSWS